jgi:hypothetical protein
MSPSMLVGCLLVSVLLSGTASSEPSIPTRIIPGGEVAIEELNARYDGQSISISGTGFEIFPGRTCGLVEIGFLDAKGRLLLRKDVAYRTPDWYRHGAQRSPYKARTVSFFLKVPASAPPALIFTRHQSTGGCEHAWSLQFALDWLIYKMSSSRR